MTRKGAALKSLGKDPRYKTVSCSLRGVLSSGALFLLPRFEKYAQSNGIYSYLVSLAVNALLQTHDICIEDWYKFYLDVWAATAHYFSPKGMSGNQHSAFVAGFFAELPLSDADREVLSYKSPALTRQQECTQMATNAKEHLKAFFSRMHRYISAALVTFQIETGAKKIATKNAKLAFHVTKAICCLPSEYDSHITKVQARCDAASSELFEWVEPLVIHERRQLGHLVTEEVVWKKCNVPLLQRVVNEDSKLYLLVPHLRRISVCSEEMLRHAQSAVTEEEEEDDDDEVSADSVPTEAAAQRDARWTKKRRPRPFQLLPLKSLQRSMTMYNWTEMKHMFCELKSELKASSQEKLKRKRDDEMAIEEGPLPLFGLEPKNDDAFQHIFDLSRIKGVKKNNGWILASFRTDGVKCTLTFASQLDAHPSFHGAPQLLKPGYGAIPTPIDKIDVYREQRGLYRINENRNDLSVLPEEERSGVELCVVDPGFCRVLQCGIMPASTDPAPLSVANALTCDGRQWHMTHDEWMASSGRLQLQQSETRRRKMCPSYENAIVHLSATRKRTANPATFRNHCRVAAKEFGTLRCELTHIGRSHIRWQADKALQRFMARVTNRMFRNESCRLHRHDVLPEARAELRQTLRASRSRAEKTVVFFGDGTFKSSMKGKQSVPKKKLLKVLAATGVTVLLGEYNTSKMCPCGTDELITPRSTTELQLRVHKTTGDKCSVLKVVDNRDEVSTVQFGQAALRCLAVWCWASASLSAV